MRILGILLTLLLASSCAMLREGNPETTPKTGPGTDYPCGVHGQQCFDTTPPTCCEYGKCANDGEPYCDNRPPSDPTDPTTWSRKLPARLPRKAIQ
jgi:hypothetical protein